jgi:hypothetical protein
MITFCTSNVEAQLRTGTFRLRVTGALNINHETGDIAMKKTALISKLITKNVVNACLCCIK